MRYARAPRVVGVDVARTLAIFGMIGVHVGIAAGIDPERPLGWYALVEGRSSILFAVVAGISVALATGSATLPAGEALRSARLRLAGRAIAVLSIGLVLEMLGTEIAVILPIYGVLFLLIIPFVGMRPQTLVLISVGLALAGPTLVALVTTATGGVTGAAVQFLIAGSYPLTVWMPLMLAGIAVGRCDLRRLRTAVVVTVTGAASCLVGYSLGSGFQGTADAWLVPVLRGAPGGSFPASGSALSGSVGVPLGRMPAVDLPSALAQAWGVSPHSGGTFEIIGSGGLALFVVGLCVLAGRRLRPLLVPLAAVGAMPLTAYAAHVVSFAVLASPLALAPGVLNSGSGEAATAFWLVCIAVLLVACTVWALSVGRGPLERLTAWAAGAIDRPTSGSRRSRGSA